MIKSLYINVNMQIGFHMEVMMNSQFVRIESITIENFKNVRKGVLDFENRRKMSIPIKTSTFFGNSETVRKSL